MSDLNQIQKTPILKRFPPGDRWVPVEMGDDSIIFNTLTDGLEWVFKNYNTKKFVVDAENQIVYIIKQEERVTLPEENRYSIYGE